MKRVFLFVVLAASMMLISSCQKKSTAPQPAPSASHPSLFKPASPPAPSPLVTVTFGPDSKEFWPFLGTNFSGAPQDPINLIFVGQADPRAIRAALLALDGDRSSVGLPNVPPFNFTWSDNTSGEEQTGYGSQSGWVGSAIQLACGPFGPIRFHLRLFDIGDWTLGNAHFELQVPGTTEHQVLSWELAEQLVVADFVRSGLLDPGVPMMTTGLINPAPFREIPAFIYNGLPEDLKALIGGPPGSVVNPVPIGTDGDATILNLAQTAAGEPGVARQNFTIEFNQVIPKPFCASGPFDFLLVQGPVDFTQTTVLASNGSYVSQFQAQGHLDLTPVDPTTNPPAPIGETYQAVVIENHKGIVTDQKTLTSSFQMQLEIPPAGPFRGQLLVRLNVGKGGPYDYSLEVNCEP
ncbi:MAG: hypothetical protein L0Z48_06675 [candidate division Zixibacteria bacterium]|nr:hypothetical protein [candidate division Zixibacteria bacterium]MCI0596209.1 hypothetical protein [candidate division Zixibacteria bacterium]